MGILQETARKNQLAKEEAKAKAEREAKEKEIESVIFDFSALKFNLDSNSDSDDISFITKLIDDTRKKMDEHRELIESEATIQSLGKDIINLLNQFKKKLKELTDKQKAVKKSEEEKKQEIRK